MCFINYLYNVHKNQATQHRMFNSQQVEKVTKLALWDLKHTPSFNTSISFEILDFQIPGSYLTSFRTDSLQDFPGFKGRKNQTNKNTCPCFSSVKWDSVKNCYCDTGVDLQNEKKKMLKTEHLCPFHKYLLQTCSCLIQCIGHLSTSINLVLSDMNPIHKS